MTLALLLTIVAVLVQCQPNVLVIDFDHTVTVGSCFVRSNLSTDHGNICLMFFQFYLFLFIIIIFIFSGVFLSSHVAKAHCRSRVAR
jgi:hypothetical protein